MSDTRVSALKNYAWMVVGLLWFVALLNYLDRLMITTMRDPIKASIPMSDAQFGLLTSVFLWVYAVVSPLGGYLADRFSRRGTILGSLAVWSAMTWLTAHVHTFGQLLAVRALMGISEACYVPAALALIADYHRGSTRSLATGVHMSGIYAGAALGGVGGWLAQHVSWRFGFSLFGAIGVGYAVLLFFTLRNAPRCEGEAEGNGHRAAAAGDSGLTVAAALRALFSQTAFLVLLGLNALVGVANWGINGWLPTYLKEHFHLGLGAAGLSATVYIQLASLAGVLIGGAWADRWSRVNPRGRALVPALGYLAAGPFLFLTATTPLLPLAIIGMVMFGLGRGFFDANHMPILRSVVDQRYSATGYGVLNFISCLAGGVMVYVGGWLMDKQVDLNKVFQLSAFGLVVVGVMLLFVKRRGQAVSLIDESLEESQRPSVRIGGK